MLLPDQVVPFLQHDDSFVREHALRYFRNGYDFGPLTADHYWAVIDRLGENDHTLSFAAGLSDLPQTDGSLRRLIDALGAKASELFDFHYQHVARDMQLNLLVSNRERLLGCAQLLPHVREHLELRLNLLDESPAIAWDRLMQHGRELGNEYATRFNHNLSDALIEAAARGGGSICEQAMITLDDESAAEDWREIFAVKVLGLARYEPAIDALVEKFAIDTDVLREEANRALARISTPGVIERILEFYPGKPWHVRLYANNSLARIKCPQSEEGLLKLLDVELSLDADPNYEDEGEPLIDAVLLNLTELGSLAGLDESRRRIADSPEDPEVLDLCECLLATAVMTGAVLPEEAAWRKLLKKRDERIAARSGNFAKIFDDMRAQWRKTGISSPLVDNTEYKQNRSIPEFAKSIPDRYDDRLEPIRNAAPKIGRNDPCSCGSGKKYKKCCGK